MKYTVADVLAECPAGEAGRAFAVPTQLDGALNWYFFPAPTKLGYGRTLDLAKDENCDRLVSEILHRRIAYKPEHLYKIGTVSRPIPEIPLRELRNTHLWCLRIETDRDDFGEEIPDHVRG